MSLKYYFISSIASIVALFLIVFLYLGMDSVTMASLLLNTQCTFIGAFIKAAIDRLCKKYIQVILIVLLCWMFYLFLYNESSSSFTDEEALEFFILAIPVAVSDLFYLILKWMKHR